MTLYVTEEIINSFGVCSAGASEFVKAIETYPNGQMPYKDFLKMAFDLDKTYPEEHFLAFAINLKTNFLFYKMQGAYTMTDKFKVFNHKTGLHEELGTLEEALLRRQEILTEFFKENAFMFSVNREVIVGDGPDTMWVPISDLPPPTSVDI